MSRNQPNLQDAFLNCVRRENVGVVIYMLDGSQLRGTIKGFDSFTVVLETAGKLQLVYKHAVASILPVKHLGNIFTRPPAEPKPKES